jgi:hypothetical protein
LIYDEDPLVKVSIYEVTCEYNYSNPAQHFNLSLPHIELKTNNYQTMSYVQYKRMLLENERKLQEEAKRAAAVDSTTTSDTESNVVMKDPQEGEAETGSSS